jgi:2,3-dihydroxyphenylpropionate 1,2-dioxygenase
MGKIVAAMATVHAPQLFVRPPSEDPAQLDADIAAMRQLGKDLEESKPDAVIVIGNDHLETFFSDVRSDVCHPFRRAVACGVRRPSL